ncbi:MAG: hypothetical protein JXB29_08900 [Sedimentisphaerales bacterium]|nr:hypothetical protein [Sedimentisphaerales bacterium]
MAFRSKLIFLLIVYFAGFATAIYCLAPVPEDSSQTGQGEGFVYSTIKSDDLARSFNSGMHKCIAFGKTAACKAGKYIRHKYDDLQENES